MSGTILFKTPDERLDFDVDFTRWLPAGDALASSVNTISGGTATIDTAEVSNTVVKLWIEGGAADETNDVKVVATTAEGRVCEACFRLRIKEC